MHWKMYRDLWTRFSIGLCIGDYGLDCWIVGSLNFPLPCGRRWDSKSTLMTKVLVPVT